MTKKIFISFLFICCISVSAKAQNIVINEAVYNHTPGSEVIFELKADKIKKDKAEGLVNHNLHLKRKNIDHYKNLKIKIAN